MARKPKPCVNATLWEVNQGKHLTTTQRKDGTCENCRVVLRVFEHRRMAGEQEALDMDAAE